MKNSVRKTIESFDLYSIRRTPAYVVFEDVLQENMKTMQYVIDNSGCKILLALKCFSMVRAFPLLSKTLHGVCASGAHEARLGREHFEGLVSTYSPAFSSEDIEESAKNSDHLVFNSFNQYRRFRDVAKKNNPEIRFAIRVNPEITEEKACDMYNPCREGSRLGVVIDEFEPDQLDGIEGLHFHALCRMGTDVLEKVIHSFEQKFGDYIDRMKWVNFGGGHWITQDNYDVEALISLINDFRERHPGVEVYLEPGEAHVFNAGIVASSVLDIARNGDTQNIIVDASATCHMPDIIEMSYVPDILHAGKVGEKKHEYQIGSATCLSGDMMGRHSFDRELEVGDRIAFLNMALYTMVKTTTFNGTRLPDIYFVTSEGKVEQIKESGYHDFINRLSD